MEVEHPNKEIEILNVSFANLRGFTSSTVELLGDRLLVVGPNNSGKTSLFKVLDWVFNYFEPTVDKPSHLSQLDAQLLLPARDTRNKARRITFKLKLIGDRFKNIPVDHDSVCTLRINIRLSPTAVVFASIGETKRGEKPLSTKQAVLVITALKENYRCIHIPSFRNSDSDRFIRSFKQLVQKQVSDRALHSSQGGAGRTYRALKKAFEDISNETNTVTKELWGQINNRLPAGLTKEGSVSFDCSYEDFVEFLQSKLKLKVSTGEHDEKQVQLSEVGAGLQSLLDLALHLSLEQDQYVTYLLIDEPEAFLHPSAQRAVARNLFASGSTNTRLLISTHSPIFLEEAEFKNIVICRNQKYYQSKARDPKRQSISSSLITAQGAEMMFADSVLLVEGPGDVQFFEALRQRLAKVDDKGIVDRCFVIATGSVSSYAPWIKLLNSYGDASDRPIKWIAAPDADSPNEIITAFKHAEIPLRSDIRDKVSGFDKLIADDNLPDWKTKVSALNEELLLSGLPLCLLCVDLEDSMLRNAGDEFLNALSEFCGWDDTPSKKQIKTRLGSKAHSKPVSPNKAPYIRAFIGQSIKFGELTENTKLILKRWLENASSANQVETLFEVIH